MIKPERTPFVFFWWTRLSAILTVIILGAFLGCRAFSIDAPTYWFLVPWIAILVMMIGTRPAAYRKEEYDLLADKLVRRGGGLLSDSRSELIARNITYVAVVRPWLERRLFGTGTVIVRAAGGGAVSLRNVADPDGVYGQVQQLMRKNGFQLQRKEILQQEKPSQLGIALEMIGQLFGVLVFGGFVAGPFFLALLAAILLESNAYAGTLLALLAAVAIYIIARICIGYLDRRRRTYTAYADTITHSDGFLTTSDAFMPIENLSDVQTNQGLVSRALGIYDVVISCQGGGQEIEFTNMENGAAFSKVVERLLLTKKRQPEPKANKEAPGKAVAGSSFTTELQMHRPRVTTHWLMGIGVFLVLFITSLVLSIATQSTAFLIPLTASPIIVGLCGIMAALGFVNASATSYAIKRSSVERTYSFLAKAVTEFSMDKITGVVVKEGVLDRWYGTQTIEFWSVGSTSTVTFKAIKKQEGIIAEIFAKLGLKKETANSTMRPVASLWMLSCSQPVLHLAFIGALIASFIVHPPLPFSWVPTVALLAIAASRIAIFKAGVPKMHLTMFPSYATFQRGIWLREQYLVQNEDIKSISARRYLLTRSGGLKFDVAGERVVEDQRAVISNGFSVPYLLEIEGQAELADNSLAGKRSASAGVPKMMASPNIAQKTWFPIAIAVAIGILIWWNAPLLDREVPPTYTVIAILFALVSILRVRKRKYAIEDGKIVERWGLFSQRRKSIIFSKIDTIEQNVGVMNKLFGTGTVLIRTTGSSGGVPEMAVRDVRDHQRFYDTLRKEYR